MSLESPIETEALQKARRALDMYRDIHVASGFEDLEDYLSQVSLIVGLDLLGSTEEEYHNYKADHIKAERRMQEIFPLREMCLD
jgi:hypothetical protein